MVFVSYGTRVELTTFLCDTYAEMERLVRRSTDWTFVRPPKLTDKALT
jgi:hypothetical protein